MHPLKRTCLHELVHLILTKPDLLVLQEKEQFSSSTLAFYKIVGMMIRAFNGLFEGEHKACR